MVFLIADLKENVKQTLPLKSKYQFGRTYRKGERYSSKHLTLYCFTRRDQRLYRGVAVAKKLKGSVRRNRVKRWLRELYRHSEHLITPGYDLILLGRVTPEECTYQQLFQEWQKILQKSGIVRINLKDANSDAEKSFTNCETGN